LKLGDALLTRRPDSDAGHRVIGGVIRQFVPLDRRQEFSDVGYRALPADNAVPVRTLLRTHFTEIWLPIEETDRVVATLERMFLDQAVAGNFLVELYGAKRSPFWLSPSYDRDVVRVDAYAWAHNRGRPEDQFAHYWDHLLDIPGARLHWGKTLPGPGQVHGKTVFGLGYLKSVYPMLAPWLERRARMDPDRVFLIDYWRSILEIT
jgi:D-arabinono-1,4-lactone oxidase